MTDLQIDLAQWISTRESYTANWELSESLDSHLWERKNRRLGTKRLGKSKQNIQLCKAGEAELRS